LAGYVPEATALNNPYVIKGETAEERYKNYKKVTKERDVIQNILEEAHKHGLHFVKEAVWRFGDRHVTSNKPIEKPEDLEGLVIRTPDAKAHSLPFELLGANVTPMPIGDVYTALSHGTIDAQENPVNIIYESSFY